MSWFSIELFWPKNISPSQAVWKFLNVLLTKTVYCSGLYRNQKYLKEIGYTVLRIFTQVLFWVGNQSNHQNFDPSLHCYPINVTSTDTCFVLKGLISVAPINVDKFSFGWSKNLKKKSKWVTKKLRFSTPPIVNIFWKKF